MTLRRCRIASWIVLVIIMAANPWMLHAQRRAMTVDDDLDMVDVSNPLISPDGRWVLFSRSELRWNDNKRESHFWMVSADGGTPFQFTSGDSDSSPQWAPDSRTIAFLRGRGEQGAQIHLIRVNGGEAVKLSDHKDGLSSFRWSADGQQIFFLANDAKSDEQKKKEKAGDDVNFVDEGPNCQTRRGQWNNLWVLNVADKQEKQITKEKLIIRGFDPSPDASRIAFQARSENSRNGGYLSEIFVADVATGNSTRITDNEAPENSVRWHPDGKSISFLAPDDKKWELALPKFWVVDVETKNHRRLPSDFEGSIGDYAWKPDGTGILFAGQQRTHRNLYELDVTTGKARPMTQKIGVFDVSDFSSDGTRAAATFSTPQIPPDVWVVDVQQNKETQLTRVNPQIEDLQLAESKIIQWKSKDGLEIEGILYLPDGHAGTRLPLILVIHGGPAGSFTYGFRGLYHVYTGLGYALLAPNVRGSSGYTDALLRGNMYDIGGGDYWDLMTGVDTLVEQGIVDPDKMGVKGWSYGGILGGWTITQTDRFKAASLGAMVSDWSSEYAMGFNHDVRLWYIGKTPWENPDGYREMSAYTHIAKVKTPTILFHGEEDTTDTIGQSMIYYQALKDRGVPTRFLRFPREGHGFREPHHQRIRDVEEIAWMQKHIRNVEWSSQRPEEKKGEPEKQKTIQ